VRARLGARLRDDRGSLTAVVVLWTPIVMVLAAFVVDMGFLMSQRNHASDLAEQAARRVADDLNPVKLRAGQYALNTDFGGGCMTDAKDYLASSGADLSTTSVTQCTVTPPGLGDPPTDVTVKVIVQFSYQPLLAGLFVSGPITIREQGIAHPTTG
jgi:Flp pilus assembly protein TadG